MLPQATIFICPPQWNKNKSDDGSGSFFLLINLSVHHVFNPRRCGLNYNSVFSLSHTQTGKLSSPQRPGCDPQVGWRRFMWRFQAFQKPLEKRKSADNVSNILIRWLRLYLDWMACRYSGCFSVERTKRRPVFSCVTCDLSNNFLSLREALPAQNSIRK